MAQKATHKKKGTMKTSRYKFRFRRPSCLKVVASDDSPSAAAAAGGGGGGDGGERRRRRAPTHLVVTVNGIVGSAENWKYAAKQFTKKYPEDVIVLCSECNGATRTLHGVDVMGKRLAEEVMSFVASRPELEKISFVGHSLGGLVARYAIALLYDSKFINSTSGVQSTGKNEGKIAGLEPINFITFATPHLGSRSHKQIPILRGVHSLEKLVYNLSWIAGRSGKHLFLKDREEGKPPLLLRMVHDSGDLHFMSALRSFKRHVAYSNVSFDFIVGWKTSSIRHQHELPKRENFVRNGRYPHIVYEEKPRTKQQDEFSESVIYQAKSTNEMEEAMMRGLNRIPWERVDVSFKKSKQRIFAHSTIQVKTYFLNSDGADVIFHMIDNFVL